MRTGFPTVGFVSLAVCAFSLTGCPPEGPSSNSNSSDQNAAPTVVAFSVTPLQVEVGEPVTISWIVADANGDPLTVVVSVDRESRDDYVIEDGLKTTTQQHVFTSAGKFGVHINVFDGKSQTGSESIEVIADGPISINQERPYGGQVISGESVPVCANVVSKFEIDEVSTTTLGQTLLMARGIYCQTDSRSSSGFTGYVANVPVRDTPSGTYLTIVHVRDVLGNEASVLRRFVIDRPPTITVVEPLSEDVVGTTAHVRIECTDADGVCAGDAQLIWERFPDSGLELGALGDVLEKDVDLSAANGNAVRLAVSSPGKYWSPYWFYVEENAHLTRVARFGGRLADADGFHGLIATIPQAGVSGISYDHPPTEWGGLSRVARDGGTEYAVPVPADARLRTENVHLSSNGVVYVATTGTVHSLYFWDGDVQTNLGAVNLSSLQTAGYFAAWAEHQATKLCDLRTLSTVDVSTQAAERFALAPDGTVAFVEGSALKRYRAGVTTTLLQDDSKLLTTPVIDGEFIVVAQYDRTGGANTRLWLIDDAGTVTDIAGDLGTFHPLKSYAVSGGWVAWLQPSVNGVKQVWRRSPQGDAVQLTFFGDSSSLDGINPTGEVLFRHDDRRHLARLDKQLVDVGSTQGEFLLIEGKWHVAIGRVLFSVAVP